MDAQAPTPPWSGLRKDLLLNIANRIDSRVDVLRFRAVCYSWRSVLPPPNRKSTPPSSPLKLLFPIGPNPSLNPRRRGFFNLIESTVYSIQPLKKISDTWKISKCWLIKIEETDELGKVRLKDPLSRVHFENLSLRLPKSLNLLEYRVSEVTKVYGLRFVGTGKKPEIEFNELKSINVKKVSVCSEGAGFAVLAVHTAGKLSMWRMGDKKWIHINYGPERAYFEDVTCHKGKFYAVEHSGLTISIDSSLNITQVAPAMPRSGFNKHGGQYKYLVNSLGDLFLLDKDFNPDHDIPGLFDSDEDDDTISTYFQAYKLNEEKRKWDPVKSLGNRAMFVGDDCTFSVSAHDFPGCKKNCIYFDELFGGDSNDDHPGFDAALFDMEDCSAKMLSTVFSYSGLFWPPPAWVMTGACSLGR